VISKCMVKTTDALGTPRRARRRHRWVLRLVEPTAPTRGVSEGRLLQPGSHRPVRADGDHSETARVHLGTDRLFLVHCNATGTSSDDGEKFPEWKLPGGLTLL
jgi:hypothetical protein